MPNKLIVRTSDRKQFVNCREAWDMGSKIRRNFEPNREAIHFAFGTAIHAGLETLYDPRTWHLRNTSELQALAVAAFVEKWPKPKDADFEDEAQWRENLELGKGMLMAYFEWAKTRDKFTPKFVEIEFEVPIPYPFALPYTSEIFRMDDNGYLTMNGEPVFYQGRIDLLLEDEYGNYWVADHKTTGQLGTTEHLEMDEQCSSYAWAVQEMLGIKVKGILYNELLKDLPHKPKVLKSGKLSVDKSQNTTYELYLETINELKFSLAEYSEILEHFKTQGNKFFRRTPVQRSQKSLEMTGQRIALQAIDMLDPNVNIYPNPGKFNCKNCTFRSPCLAKMEGSDYESLLNENFHVRS